LAKEERFKIYLDDLDRRLLPVTEQINEDVSDDETSSSGVSSYTSTISNQQFSSKNTNRLAQLFEEIMTSFEKKNSLMKVYKSFQFTKSAIDLYMKDEDLKNQWIKMVDYYENHLKCTDYDRIKFEFSKCLDALLNDERKIMMGLESIDVIKDVLITTMRICTEPNFQLEIRVGLGGTVQPPTARVPSYTTAAIALLLRLSLLSKYFSSDKKSLPG
jgi:hypothetical protein